MPSEIHNILALDIGQRRIGAALANSLARLPSALVTLNNDASIWDQVDAIIKKENIGAIVVGLPRSLNGGETAQTRSVRDFAGELKRRTDLPIHFQDEALTSHQAEAELRQTDRAYDKADIDARAAVIILGDYLNSHSSAEVMHG